jgi:hypothetical protein
VHVREDNLGRDLASVLLGADQKDGWDRTRAVEVQHEVAARALLTEHVLLTKPALPRGRRRRMIHKN